MTYSAYDSVRSHINEMRSILDHLESETKAEGMPGTWQRMRKPAHHLKTFARSLSELVEKEAKD